MNGWSYSRRRFHETPGRGCCTARPGIAEQDFRAFSGIGIAGLVVAANHGQTRASTRDRKARLSAASTTGATGYDTPTAAAEAFERS